MSGKLIVAIDGPAGAGKSTVARHVAEALDYAYLDSGAMYRSVALLAQRSGADPDDAGAVTPLAEAASIDFAPGSPQRVLLDGEDVTGAIRTPEISALASRVSVHPGVRRAMVRQQRKLGAAGGVVMEGRDIGSVVFPEAGLKIFLTASAKERARRRTEQLASKGDPPQFDTVLADIVERDRRDTTRADSPLVRADDAVELDTDGKTPDDVVTEIVALARAREGSPEVVGAGRAR